jgi:prepilin-type N-terminal cleavage/methylation domain-containing protein
MKKSFTMIELIFVIVILGILAAVAIPKLAATRDDARTVTLTTQIKTGTKELISYYTSQGGEINFSKLPTTSQVALNEFINKGWVEVKSDTRAVFYDDRNTKTVCLIYITNGEQFRIEQNTTNNSTLCTDIKRVIKDRNYSVLNGIVNF